MPGGKLPGSPESSRVWTLPWGPRGGHSPHQNRRSRTCAGRCFRCQTRKHCCHGLLNLANSGLFAFDVAILAMGIFYGGIAQIFAGLLEYKKGNTFGLTAFTSYGSFWLTLVAILLMPKMGLAEAPNAHFLGMYLGLWGVFTLFMFFGTLKAARMLQFVFLSLTVLFALLAIGHLVDNEGIVKVAGWVGLVCGASAIYLAMGEVLNEQFGRTVLPIGEPR